MSFTVLPDVLKDLIVGFAYKITNKQMQHDFDTIDVFRSWDLDPMFLQRRVWIRDDWCETFHSNFYRQILIFSTCSRDARQARLSKKGCEVHGYEGKLVLGAGSDRGGGAFFNVLQVHSRQPRQFEAGVSGKTDAFLEIKVHAVVLGASGTLMCMQKRRLGVAVKEAAGFESRGWSLRALPSELF